jgi:hypothetical protein
VLQVASTAAGLHPAGVLAGPAAALDGAAGRLALAALAGALCRAGPGAGVSRTLQPDAAARAASTPAALSARVRVVKKDNKIRDYRSCQTMTGPVAGPVSAVG